MMPAWVAQILSGSVDEKLRVESLGAYFVEHKQRGGHLAFCRQGYWSRNYLSNFL